MADADVMGRVWAEVSARFPGVQNLGIWCRRPINQTGCEWDTLPIGATWSQHAYGNALDIGVTSKALGDRVHRYLIQNRQRLQIGTILWNVPNHYDHLHVEGVRRRTGNPPGAGGGGRPASGSTIGVDPETGEFVIIGPDGSTSPAGDPSLVDEIEDVTDFLRILAEPATWLRVLWFVLGTGAAVGSVVMFARELGVTVPLPPAASLARNLVRR